SGSTTSSPASCCGASSRATCGARSSEPLGLAPHAPADVDGGPAPPIGFRAPPATPAPMSQLPATHAWDPAAALGKTFGAGVARVVLLIRRELLHRYPDALIYAAKAKTLQAVGTEEKVPLFRGRIDPDITFLGF